MRKLTYKINALAGCNVRGRLKYIRDLLKDGEHDKALNETRCLLHFVSDRDESSKETEEPTHLSKRVNISDRRGSDGRFI